MDLCLIVCNNVCMNQPTPEIQSPNRKLKRAPKDRRTALPGGPWDSQVREYLQRGLLNGDMAVIVIWGRMPVRGASNREEVRPIYVRMLYNATDDLQEFIVPLLQRKSWSARITEMWFFPCNKYVDFKENERMANELVDDWIYFYPVSYNRINSKKREEVSSRWVGDDPEPEMWERR